jgi:hypothetical protein
MMSGVLELWIENLLGFRGWMRGAAELVQKVEKSFRGRQRA